MKKILFLWGLLCVPLWSAAENKISMVTYFPVPYVAYSNLNVQEQMDIGTGLSCNMRLGGDDLLSTLRPLLVGNTYLTKGRLDFNTAAAIRNASFSVGKGAGSAIIDFQSNLRLISLQNGYTVQANQMLLDSLSLFPSRVKNVFPSCAATGAAGAPTISWQALKLKDTIETYLVCGASQEVVDCTDPSYKSSHKSVCCPSAPQTDTVCWTKKYYYAPPFSCSVEEYPKTASNGTERDNWCQWYGTGGLALSDFGDYVCTGMTSDSCTGEYEYANPRTKCSQSFTNSKKPCQNWTAYFNVTVCKCAVEAKYEKNGW